MSEYNPFSAGVVSREIEAVMRFSAVKRWHMLDTTKQQSLAEHSANVALLVFLIATTAPGLYFGDPAWLAGAALLHDLPEVFTGDIPTHTKKRLEGVAKLEHEVVPVVFASRIEDKPDAKILVKMCDLVEAIHFIRRHGRDDHIARHACTGLVTEFERLITTPKWPEEVLMSVFRVLYPYLTKWA